MRVPSLSLHHLPGVSALHRCGMKYRCLSLFGAVNSKCYLFITGEVMSVLAKYQGLYVVFWLIKGFGFNDTSPDQVNSWISGNKDPERTFTADAIKKVLLFLTHFDHSCHQLSISILSTFSLIWTLWWRINLQHLDTNIHTNKNSFQIFDQQGICNIIRSTEKKQLWGL